MIESTELELIFGMMVTFTKENGIKEKEMEMALIDGIMGMNIKEIGLMIKEMGKVFIFKNNLKLIIFLK